MPQLLFLTPDPIRLISQIPLPRPHPSPTSPPPLTPCFLVNQRKECRTQNHPPQDESLLQWANSERHRLDFTANHKARTPENRSLFPLVYFPRWWMNAELKYEGCLVQVINWWARLGRCEKPEFQGFYDISFLHLQSENQYQPSPPPPLSTQ